MEGALKKRTFILIKIEIMKKIKFLVASFLFCAMSYVGYMGYERMTMSEAERFMLANVEALTSEEGGNGSGYCVMHFPCYDTYGNHTGKYSASSYTGPNCRGAYHSHICSSCKSL